MKISKSLKDFISTYSEDINKNNFNKLYYDILLKEIKNIGNDLWAADIGQFTSILYNIEIDPLLYMQSVPPLFLYDDENIHNVKIPSNIVGINNQAFTRSSINSLYIPDQITKIGDGIFTSCGKLKKVTFGKGIVSIGENIFRGFILEVQPLKLYYRGTMEQWENISIDNYNPVLFNKEIYCADGILIYYDGKWYEKKKKKNSRK